MPLPPATYNCVGGVCVDPGDGTGTYPTLAACLAACSSPPPPPPPFTTECSFSIPGGEEGAYAVEDCAAWPSPPAGGEFLVIHSASAFGDPTPTECEIYDGVPGYVVEREYREGCCECPCIPPDVHELHAAVSSTGGCPWNGTIVLTEVVPRALPRDTRCFVGSIGTEPCILYVTLCCNCGGPGIALQVGTPGASVCADGCCSEGGTCGPVLEWTAVHTCHWIGTGAADCCIGTITVVVTL